MARASRPVGPRRTHCFVVHPVTLVEVAARLIKSQQLKHSHLHSDRHFKPSTSSELRLRAPTVAPEPRHASRRAAGPSGTERNQNYWPPNFVVSAATASGTNSTDKATPSYFCLLT